MVKLRVENLHNECQQPMQATDTQVVGSHAGRTF